MLEIQRIPSGANEHSLNAMLVGRSKVPGGWLVFTTGLGGCSPSVCFYPDPEHAWSGASLGMTPLADPVHKEPRYPVEG